MPVFGYPACRYAGTQSPIHGNRYAGSAGCVDHRPIAAELGAIDIRQRLELGDRLNPQGRSQTARARPVIPEVDHILVIQQVGLAGGARSSDGILLPIAVESAACAGSPQRDLGHAGSQRQQGRVIPAVQRKLTDLRAFDQRAHAVDWVSTTETSP
jgi:hypothetical protein